MIWETILENLINVGYGVALFIVAYLSNMLFSLWYNIKMLSQPFDYKRLLNSGLKILCFGGALALLSLVVCILPVFADTVGWSIPEEYIEVFANLAVIGMFLLASTKYIMEAWNKMKAILFDKIDNSL